MILPHQELRGLCQRAERTGSESGPQETRVIREEGTPKAMQSHTLILQTLELK